MENLYETDFYRWKQQQKEHLVSRRFDPLDLERVIEEFDDRGNDLPFASAQIPVPDPGYKPCAARELNLWRSAIRAFRRGGFAASCSQRHK